MRMFMPWVSCFLLFTQAGWCVQQTKAHAETGMPAAIEGRLSVIEGVGRSVEARPFRNVTVYLLDLEQSKPLQELQHQCRTATAKPGNDFVAVNVCLGGLSEAVKLVPSLPSTARAQSDRDGVYKFESVPPGRRYQVVCVLVDEGEPVVLVGLTPKLKPGKRVTLDLRENDPWTDSDPLARR
jgi:hypothetical protein